MGAGEAEPTTREASGGGRERWRRRRRGRRRCGRRASHEPGGSGHLRPPRRPRLLRGHRHAAFHPPGSCRTISSPVETVARSWPSPERGGGVCRRRVRIREAGGAPAALQPSSSASPAQHAHRSMATTASASASLGSRHIFLHDLATAASRSPYTHELQFTLCFGGSHYAQEVFDEMQSQRKTTDETQVQEIQEVGQSKVVLEDITVAHRCPGQKNFRLCVDISNLDTCYLLGNYVDPKIRYLIRILEFRKSLQWGRDHGSHSRCKKFRKLGKVRLFWRISLLRIAVQVKIFSDSAWTSATSTHATFLEIIRLYFLVSWEAGATLAVASVVGGRREAMHSLGAVQFIGIGTTKDDHKPPCWRCVVRARNALYVFIEAEHNIRPLLSTT